MIGETNSARKMTFVDRFETREEYLLALRKARRVLGNGASFAWELPLVRGGDYVPIGRQNVPLRAPKRLVPGASERIADVLDRLHDTLELRAKTFRAPAAAPPPT